MVKYALNIINPTNIIEINWPIKQQLILFAEIEQTIYQKNHKKRPRINNPNTNNKIKQFN